MRSIMQEITNNLILIIISFAFGMLCIALRDLYFERKTATNVFARNILYEKKFEIYQFI